MMQVTTRPPPPIHGTVKTQKAETGGAPENRDDDAVRAGTTRQSKQLLLCYVPATDLTCFSFWCDAAARCGVRSKLLLVVPNPVPVAGWGFLGLETYASSPAGSRSGSFAIYTRTRKRPFLTRLTDDGKVGETGYGFSVPDS